MNTLVLLCCTLVGVSSAAKLDGLVGAAAGNLLISVNTNDHSHQANELVSPNNDGVTGSYSWTAPNGESFTVNYVADEAGFRPVLSRGGSVGSVSSGNQGAASFGAASGGSASRFASSGANAGFSSGGSSAVSGGLSNSVAA